MDNKYINAFSRFRKHIVPITKEYGTSKLFFYIDALLSFIRYGITPNEYLGWSFWELSSLKRKQFYTARHSNKWEKRFNDPKYADYFNLKYQTNQIFSKFINRAWLYTGNSSEKQIESFIKSHPRIIIKPTSLSSGKGIKLYTNESINELKAANVLLEEYIIQHPKMASLNSSSVNSIRVYTLTTPSNFYPQDTEKINNTIFISASIRVGGIGSTVDNYHAGGVGYPLDIKHGVVCGAGKGINGQKFLYHPGNNVKIIGFEIPNWGALKNYIVSLNSVIPQARLIAWDIAITPTDFELIEANYQGDPGFMQAPTQCGKKRLILNNY